MRKAWRFIGALALVFLIIGIFGVGVGFFTGSSPVAIQSHGSLEEYFERLAVNWNIIKQSVTDTLRYLPF